VQQQLDVLEQEVAALGSRDRSCGPAVAQRERLLEDPGIAQRTAADEDAGNRPGSELRPSVCGEIRTRRGSP
jgi:hypothetical protein